jgi:hypothetical protein
VCIINKILTLIIYIDHLVVLSNEVWWYTNLCPGVLTCRIKVTSAVAVILSLIMYWFVAYHDFLSNDQKARPRKCCVFVVLIRLTIILYLHLLEVMCHNATIKFEVSLPQNTAQGSHSTAPMGRE